MAGEYDCAGCDQPAKIQWLLTHLDPPLTISSCEEHLEQALITLLASRLEVEIPWLYDGIAKMVNRLAEKEAKLAEQAATGEQSPGGELAAAVAKSQDDFDAAVETSAGLADPAPEDSGGGDGGDAEAG